jgi:hypothetical protein
MADGKKKVLLAIFCIYVLVFGMIYIFAGVLLFGNSSDNPSFIKAFQVLWCVGIVFFAIGSVVSVVNYLTGMRISAYVTEQFVPQERQQAGPVALFVQEQQAELAAQNRLCACILIVISNVIWLIIFLCTFFILFMDAKNNQQWMTALLVFWCILTVMTGLALIGECCVCCVTIYVLSSARNSETRPIAH